MPKNVVIFGAGYAGVEAALTLQKRKKPSDDISITLIDKNPYHTLLTELHEVAGNRIDADGIIVPLIDIFKYTSVRIVRDQIAEIAFDKSTLTSEKGDYKYDYLIIAAGSEPNYYDIPGLKENGFSLWSYNDAIRVREHIRDCFEKAAAEENPTRKAALLTFVVGGGGFTGVEMVGELAHWTKSLCREYGIDKNSVRILLIEALSKILSNLGDKNIEKSMKYLTQKLGVEVLLESPISEVEKNSITLSNNISISTSTLIWTAGIKACNITENFNVEKAKGCRITINEYTQTQFPNVYAAGDISAFQMQDGLLPAMVEAALQTGETAAKNILSDIRGMEKEKFKPNLHGIMVSIGSYFAVSEIVGKRLPVFLSVLMKYMVNVHYLFSIGGFELVIKYLKHEFLYKKQKRNILEDHFSHVTPAFWMVPLRLFIGYSWIAEGIKKIQEGWLYEPMLSKLVADTGSSATTTESAASVAQAVEASLKIDIPLYLWFFKSFIIPNSLLFQTLIIICEIGLGLAFISGTFTFIAAIVSIALNVNFILSTGMYVRELWYIPAAICMLGGAGRAFGIDFYLMPYLMRQWRYFSRNRKIKLFLFS